MATSPNYSWPEPDNTDLVKNGALAIRTMGNAIDTTMATMTPKSTFTAKGSIAAATAASTPANVSVGTNGQVLTADSTASTGVAWTTISGASAWTTWSANPYNVTLGNGTVTARYQTIGKTVNFRWNLTFGSTTVVTGSAYFFLPVAPSYDTPCSIVVRDNGVALYPTTGLAFSGSGGYVDIVVGVANSTYVFQGNVNSTIPVVLGTGDNIYVSGTYEVA